MAGTAQGAAKAAATRAARSGRQDRGGDDAARPTEIDDGPAPQRITDSGAPTPAKAKTPRASFPADEAGDIVVEDLTPAATERLARAARKLRLVVGNQPESTIDPALVSLLYDAIGSFAAQVCVGMGYTKDSARLMAFSAEEKTMLVPLSAKVIAKYAGDIGTRWQDEIALAALLYAIVQSKASKLQKEPADVIEFPSAVQQPTNEGIDA